MTSYEDFRDVIKGALTDKAPLTWTEIRTAAKLPQLFPNNQWVRRLERDVGLVRRKDAHGIINWSLGADAAAESTEPSKRPRKTAGRKQGRVE